ncbi:MAG: glycosyltransferase family 9 protein [Candidatus Andersenbacteria bacterium]|nr:glycosyltransferase family 9 protein [Candidatus Andersenbacteria bacterium]
MNSPGKKPTKILCLALSGIGNLVMQSPVFAAIKKAHPDWHLTVWVAPRGTRALAEADPNIDEVIEAPYKNSLAGHLRFIKKLRAEKFDIGIALSPGQLVKGAAFLFLAGIPKRIGHSYPFRNNPRSSFLLTDVVEEDESLHDIEQNLRLLEPLGIPYHLQPTTYNLSLPESARQKATAMLNFHKLLEAPYPIIGIHAGSAPSFLWKRWPLENFAEVAKKLIEKHQVHIVLFGGADEKAQNEALAALISHVKVSLIQADLLTTAAVMQHCRLVLSNDSGLMHMASATGIETFGLFGPTNETHTGPRGPKSHIIRANGTEPVYNTELNHSLGQEPHPSILAITPQLVLSKIEAYL